MQTQHELFDAEVPAQVSVLSQDDTPPRDAFGRTLEQARQEDHSWREDYLTRVRAQVAGLNRLEWRTGVVGVVISTTLLLAACVAGMSIDSARHPGWSQQQGMQVFYGLIYGTVGACVLGIAGMGLWGWLQDWVCRRNQQIGIELDASSGVEEAVASAEFLDCGECGASIPAQAPTCRRCGARSRPNRTPRPAPSVNWVGRTYQTQTLSRFVRDAIRSPMDLFSYAILAIMIIAAILGWYF